MKILTVVLFGMYLTTATMDLSSSNNKFSQSVYKELVAIKPGENFLVSPFSAETVLALARSGIKGESAQELDTALHLPNKTQVETSFKDILPKFKENSYTLSTANKIYIQKNFELKSEFKNTAREVYQSDSEVIDFGRSADAARTMNQWVEDQTKQKIKNLINSKDLSIDTRAVLINALYFQANWSQPFKLEDTQKTKFFVSEKDSIEVDFIKQRGSFFKYYECPHLSAQFLELPFNGDASMVVVLPKERNGLSAVESRLEEILTLRHELKMEAVDVALPKFKIETSIDFVDVLKKLGVSKIFDPKEADLSGIAGEKGELFVSRVAQKTFIDVSENGVEAAAATYVVVMTSLYYTCPRRRNDSSPTIPSFFISK